MTRYYVENDEEEIWEEIFHELQVGDIVDFEETIDNQLYVVKTRTYSAFDHSINFQIERL